MSITFTATEVNNFNKTPRNPNLRFGQAFHQYFKLEKISGQDKDWCDKLYNADTATAKKMVEKATDSNQ